jgi:hypothetical protein
MKRSLLGSSAVKQHRDDQALASPPRLAAQVDHVKVPLLQFDHCWDRPLAFLRDEIGQFVRLNRHVLIQLVIKLKQRHHGVIVIPGTVLHRCHNLITIGRAVQQGHLGLIAEQGCEGSGSMSP